MAKVILSTGENYTVAAGNTVELFGTTGVENITVQPGASVTLDASFNQGGDTLVLSGNAANYTMQVSGTTVTLIDTINGNTIEVPAGVVGADIEFADGTRQLVIDTNAGAVKLGNDTVTDQPTTPTDSTTGGNDITYSIAADVNSVTEGETVTFTVTASSASDTDQVLTYQVAGAAIAGDDSSKADPLGDLGILNGQVTIPAGQTSATIELTPASDGNTEGLEGFIVQLLDSGFNVSASSSTVAIQDPVNAGQTFVLTDGVDGQDQFTGGAGNDNYTGTVNGDSSTFSALDYLDGGSGEDILTLNDVASTAGGIDLSVATIQNIETLNLLSVNDIDADASGTAVDTSNVAGLNTLNVSKAEDVFVKAADTTAINVSGAAGGDAGVGTREVFTATFAANSNDDADTIAFDGVTVTLAGSDNTDVLVAAKFVTQYNNDAGANWTAVDNEDGTVTFTAKNAGVVTDVAAVDFVVTDAGNGNPVDVTTVSVGTQGVDGGVAIINADGGSTQNLTADSQDYDVVSDNAKGAVTVTHDDQGLGTITVNDGTDVTINANSDSSTGAISVGGTDEATGAVNVTQTLTSDGSAVTGGAIAVTGGSTVDVTINGTITADKDTTGGTTLTGNDVTVTGDGNTTSVTVSNNLTDNDFAENVTTAATYETAVVTFGALKAGEEVYISEGAAGVADLSFVASKDLTAEEVAQAIANLTSGDTQASGGIVANGYFQGSLDANWTSGAASGATVTFTATSTGNKTDLTVETDATGSDTDSNNDATNDADFSISVTDGAAQVADAAVDVNVAAGAIVVDDDASSSITSITLDGYGAGSDIIDADSLETLTLSNSAQGLTVDAAVAELTLNLDNITGGVDLDLDDAGDANNTTLKTLNIVTSGTSSVADIIADDATKLNLSGTASLDTNGGQSALSKLEDVTVSGAAGLVLVGTDATVLQTIDASGTTGGVTATIDTSVASASEVAFKGGSGADNLALTSDTDVAGDIELGDGDDLLELTASTTGIAGDVDGGNGTDTVSMDTTSADTLDVDALNVTGFERLKLTGAADGETVDVNTLGFDYVTIAGVADTNATNDTFTIDSIVSGGTVVVSGTVGDGVADAADTDTVVINVADANTGNADSLNLVLSSGVDGTAVDADTVQINDVETINITTVDTFADADANGVDDNDDDNAVILSADTVTTVNIDGSADTEVQLSAGNLTSVDASAMTGGLTLTANGATAGTEVIGGSAGDVLTSDGENDVLKGNAGSDTFNVADLADVYGGADADTFNFSASTNLSKVSTVMAESGETSLTSGDVFNLFDDAGGDAAVTAFYQEGAQYNDTTTTTVEGKVAASLAQTSAGEATWFTHGDFTYIVIDGTDTNGTYADQYEEGADTVIEIAGVYDLSTAASFNATNGTLEIV